jgi:hypothetical protein
MTVTMRRAIEVPGATPCLGINARPYLGTRPKFFRSNAAHYRTEAAIFTDLRGYLEDNESADAKVALIDIEGPHARINNIPDYGNIAALWHRSIEATVELLPDLEQLYLYTIAPESHTMSGHKDQWLAVAKEARDECLAGERIGLMLECWIDHTYGALKEEPGLATRHATIIGKLAADMAEAGRCEVRVQMSERIHFDGGDKNYIDLEDHKDNGEPLPDGLFEECVGIVSRYAPIAIWGGRAGQRTQELAQAVERAAAVKHTNQ